MRLLAQQIELRLEPAPKWAQQGMGRSLQQDGLILINSDMPVSKQNLTLLHEVFHMGFDDLGIDAGERKVSAAALIAFSFIVDNPKIVQAIIDGRSADTNED